MCKELAPKLRLGLQHALGWKCGNGLPPGLNAQHLCKAMANPLRGSGGSDVGSVPALHDGAVEETPGAWNGKQRGNAHAAGRFTKNSDLDWIAPEYRNVLPYPFERGDLIEQAQVGDAVAQIKKAFST